MLYEDYIEDLSQYPASMIAEACTEYRRNAANSFFPKIGQLLALINPKWHKLLHKQKLLEKLLNNISEHKQLSAPRIKPEDWEKLKQACDGAVNA